MLRNSGGSFSNGKALSGVVVASAGFLHFRAILEDGG